MSFGIDLPDVYRQVGASTGTILKEVKPTELPVMQPTKFQLVSGMKTAKALGRTIPPSLLLRADEVLQ
jgi:putative ABC transport system substrate-binding protein